MSLPWAVPVAILAALPLAAADWKEGFVTTSDGVRLHYIEAGAGPGIVFQPGWTMPAEIWQPQIDALSKSFRVVAIDPRSQGKSDRATDGLYPERRAQDIKEVIEQLKLAPAVLVGWSLGVPEVLTYVERFGTSTLRGVVLVDGMITGEPDPKRDASFWGMLRMLQTQRAVFTSQFVRSMYKTPRSDQYLQKVIDASVKVPTNTAVVLLANAYTSGLDLRPMLTKVDKPLMFVGTAQMKEHADVVKQRAPSARIEIFEKAGHALFVDEPDRFNALLLEFASPR